MPQRQLLLVPPVRGPQIRLVTQIRTVQGSAVTQLGIAQGDVVPDSRITIAVQADVAMIECTLVP
jgi:hypothetical protein